MTTTIPTLDARGLHLTANLLDVVAHVVGTTGGGVIDTLMRVIDATKNTHPHTFRRVDETAVFVEAVEACRDAGTDHHNSRVDPHRRADAVSSAARTLRDRAYRTAT